MSSETKQTSLSRPESAVSAREENGRTNDRDDASASVDLLALAASALASSVVASLPIHELSTRRTGGRGGGLTSPPSSDGNDEKDVADNGAGAAAAAAVAIPVNHGQKNARLKLDGTVVTDADGAAQHIIVGALREVSNRIRIVGEESSVEMERGRSFRSSSATGDENDDDDCVVEGDNDDAADDQRRGGRIGWSSVENERRKKIFDMAREEVTGRYRTFRERGDGDDDGGGREEEGSARSGAGFDDREEGEEEEQEGSPPRPGGGPPSSSPPPPSASDGEGAGGDGSADEPSSLASRSPAAAAVVVEAHPSRISVFVDPLDGTSSYAKGKYEAVSTLVGIMVDNVPIFGVICKPFGVKGRPNAFGSGCHAVYGGTLLGGAYVAGGDEIELSRRHRERKRGKTTTTTTTEGKGAAGGTPPPSPSSSTAKKPPPSSSTNASGEPNGEDDSPEVPPTPGRRPRAVISASRSRGVVFDFVQHLASRRLLHPDFVHVSGAGEKTLRILTGVQNEGLWFFPKPGTSLWDVAAADALLRSIGGRLTDKGGNDIDYGRDRTDAENWEGIVACNDAKLHGEVIKLFREGNWNDDEEG